MHRHYTLNEMEKLPIWVGLISSSIYSHRNIYQARVHKGNRLDVRHVGTEAQLRDGTLDLETDQFSWHRDYSIKSWNDSFRPYPSEHERILRRLKCIISQSSEFLSKEELGQVLMELEV